MLRTTLSTVNKHVIAFVKGYVVHRVGVSVPGIGLRDKCVGITVLKVGDET